MKETILQMNTVSDAIPESMQLRFSMCRTTYPNKNYHIYRPNSDCCCLEYVLRGTGTVCIDDHVFHPKAGDTYLLLQNRMHEYYSNKQDPWEKIWVNFSGNFALTQADLLGIRHCSYFPQLDTSDLLLRFQSLTQYSNPENAAEQCAATLSALFFRLASAKTPIAKQPRSAVQRMLHWIEQHETESVSVEELANRCRLSVSQAERLFSNEMGMPIYRYVLQRKLTLAKQLLRETGMTVREIAVFLSFEDEFYFSNLFRKKIGVSPTQYRNGTHTDALRSDRPRSSEDPVKPDRSER